MPNREERCVNEHAASDPADKVLAQILRDFPRFVRLAESGRLDLGSLVSERIKLDEVNDGIAMLRRAEGKSGGKDALCVLFGLQDPLPSCATNCHAGWPL